MSLPQSLAYSWNGRPVGRSVVFSAVVVRVLLADTVARSHSSGPVEQVAWIHFYSLICYLFVHLRYWVLLNKLIGLIAVCVVRAWIKTCGIDRCVAVVYGWWMSLISTFTRQLISASTCLSTCIHFVILPVTMIPHLFRTHFRLNIFSTTRNCYTHMSDWNNLIGFGNIFSAGKKQNSITIYLCIQLKWKMNRFI